MSWIHFPSLSIRERHRRALLEILGLEKLEIHFDEFRGDICVQSLMLEGLTDAHVFPSLTAGPDFFGWKSVRPEVDVEMVSLQTPATLWGLLLPHPWNKLGASQGAKTTFHPALLQEPLISLVEAIQSWEKFAASREFSLLRLQRGSRSVQLFLHYVRGRRLRAGFIENMEEALPVTMENSQEVQIPAEVGTFAFSLSSEVRTFDDLTALVAELRYAPRVEDESAIPEISL